MSVLADKIYEQALVLPTDDRLKLIDKLLHSTNLPTRQDIDDAWALEVERRANDLESGKSRLIPGDEVLDKIRKRFGQ